MSMAILKLHRSASMVSVGGLVIAAVLFLGGCGTEPGPPSEPGARSESGAGSEAEGGSEPTGASVTDGEGAGEGLIDVEGGYTQGEQMAELEAVVEVMREHFGDEVATIDGELWSAQRHDEEVPARPSYDGYNHVINFDMPDGDVEETYATAGEIAAELGLSENINNSGGVDKYGRIFYGAGREEDRIFLIASNITADGFRATYQTRKSDDESVVAAYERIIERRRQEREEEFGPDNPRQMKDIEELEASEAAEE